MSCIGAKRYFTNQFHQLCPSKEIKNCVSFCMWLTTLKKDENKGDKCFKIKKLLELVRANCNKIEPEVNHFIDEQTIPTMVSDNAIHKNHINGVLRL